MRKNLECPGPVQNGRIISRYQMFRDYCWKGLSAKYGHKNKQ